MSKEPTSVLLKNAGKDLLAGTVGGFTICLVGHPFDTMKVINLKTIKKNFLIKLIKFFF